MHYFYSSFVVYALYTKTCKAAYSQKCVNSSDWLQTKTEVCLVSVFVSHVFSVRESSGCVMWYDFWESIKPASANLTRLVWNSHAFFRKLTSVTSESVWARYGRLVTQFLGMSDWWRAEFWRVSVIWIGAQPQWRFLWVDVAREKKKSINFERVFLFNAGKARSHTAISRTIWTHNVVLQ